MSEASKPSAHCDSVGTAVAAIIARLRAIAVRRPQT